MPSDVEDSDVHQSEAMLRILRDSESKISVLLAKLCGRKEHLCKTTKAKKNKSQPPTQSKSKNQLITQVMSVAAGTETQKHAEEDASTSSVNVPEDDCSDITSDDEDDFVIDHFLNN